MAHVLIIDCGVKWGASDGTLNHSLTALAIEELKKLGFSAESTRTDGDYTQEGETAKIMAADYIIVQTPIYWMTTPWQFKKYQDSVFYSNRSLSTGDGRHHTNPDDGYGTGGLLTNKKYMISTTWNAPKAAFTRPNDFFEGKGIDAVVFPLHKCMQFLGMKPLPTFMANDVIKNPNYPQLSARYAAHLKQVFGPLA